MNDEPSSNEQRVRSLYAYINAGELDRISELVSERFVSASGQRGGQAFLAGITALHAAFPDLQYTLEASVAAGNLVAVRWTWRGTHTGPFRSFAATGKQVSNTGQAIFELAGGKIVATSLETDRLGFLQAIGAIPYDPAFGPRPAASK